MTKGTEVDPRQDEIAPVSPALIERFAQMATMIPSEDGQAYERIVEAILSSATIDALDEPWESTKAELLLGKTLLINGLTRRPSDFKSGLRIFLVVDSVDTATGERVVWTTGSVAIVAQLVRAYALGALPCYAELIIAERPTEAGYRPHHLKFWGQPSADNPDGTYAGPPPM